MYCSVMAMLEAFVYDPLISWRLLANEEDGGDNTFNQHYQELGEDNDSTWSPPRDNVDSLKEQLTQVGLTIIIHLCLVV